MKLKKITRFTSFVTGGWGGDDVKFWTFAVGEDYQNPTSAKEVREGVQILVILW